ncbi:hypothetical protein PR202_gb08970 [Eleusine coracana subsp. coracana]|uniref:Rhodanese domain-containing protein n=1 Tax=Eleusine coracana subsp. coracana TaxID=191504 RepID=A0AAV5EGV1_ELECO|nr:hypothetical protein PR202_gb08970 [Eleusine coracana subsp. coracana]
MLCLKIREQKIKTLTPREAGYTFKLTNKALLDVRPSNERQKAWVKGSTWIPVFDVDTSADLGGLSKKFTNFVMGILQSELTDILVYTTGSVVGGVAARHCHLINEIFRNFVQQVEEKFSKDTDIILVCQKGLR